MPQAQDPCESPDKVDRQGDHGKTEIFAEERNQIVGYVPTRGLVDKEIEQGQHDGHCGQHKAEGHPLTAAMERAAPHFLHA